MYRIMVVATFRMVRDAIRSLVERQSDMQIIGEAENAPAALRLLSSLYPDVIVFDLDPETAAAIEGMRLILKDRPSVKTVAVSERTDAVTVESAVRAGVSGFIFNRDPSGDLLQVVRTVAQRGAYLSPQFATLLMDWVKKRELNRTSDPNLGVLTERELVVLSLIAEGRASKEIASALQLSVSTVQAHRKSLMRKLKIHNTAALMQFAVSAGLLVVDGVEADLAQEQQISSPLEQRSSGAAIS